MIFLGHLVTNGVKILKNGHHLKTLEAILNGFILMIMELKDILKMMNLEVGWNFGNTLTNMKRKKLMQ